LIQRVRLWLGNSLPGCNYVRIARSDLFRLFGGRDRDLDSGNDGLLLKDSFLFLLSDFGNKILGTSTC
jgi:hypothetical protein